MEKFVILLLLFVVTRLCICTAQINQPTEENKSWKPSAPLYTTFGLNLFHENDFVHFLSKNEDDNYTGGFHIRLSTNWDSLRVPIPFVKRNNIWQQFHNIGVASTAFTPQNLAVADVILDDRPYASFQYFSYSVKTVTKDINSIIDLEISVGEIGGNLAGDFQTRSHRDGWFGSTRPIPQGWANQIANGGAWSFNFHAGYQKFLFEYYSGKARWLDNQYRPDKAFKPVFLAAVTDFNAGNVVTNASAGLQIGVLNYNSTFGFNNSVDIVAISNAGQLKKWYQNISTSLVLTPRFRYVFHNAYLTGRHLNRESIHTVTTDQLIRGLFEYDALLNVGIPTFKKWLINAAYGISGRSKEFDFQNKDFHHWGGLYLGINYNF